MEIREINRLLAPYRIVAIELLQNTKASDYFVRVIFSYNDGINPAWEAVVPYIYRRSGLNIQSEEKIAEYLIGIKPCFTQAQMNRWRSEEWEKWVQLKKETKNPDTLVTIGFFETLLSFRQEVDGFPSNPNPQRRFQDLKDRGYTISIYPIGNKKWGKMLLPIPLNAAMRYETFTPQFKNRVISLFGGINAFEAKKTPVKSLIPDHKFSEVRWDDATWEENPMEMTDDELREKFQLLDNQRNQQKREVCRICYQTGRRGRLFGIDFYPQGYSEWDRSIPMRGKAAEEGCKGCPWYDIAAWRKAVNETLKKNR